MIKQLALILASLMAGEAFAAPITFNTALPVAKDEWIWREKAVVRERDDDTDIPGREVDVNALASVFGYGINERLTLFGALPYFERKQLTLTTPAGRIRRETDGIGDVTAFVRYTAYRWDGAGETFRVAPFAGVIAPTGDDDERDRFGRLPRPLQTGTGAWGGLGGVVTTYQTLRWQVDGQIAHERRGSHEGFQAGEQTRLDLSFQYRLLPRELGGGVPGFLYGVLESNWVHAGRDEIDGVNAIDSGGTQWFLTPGLQYVTRRWVLEAAVQLPVEQNMNGNALRDDYIVHAGFRINF